MHKIVILILFLQSDFWSTDNFINDNLLKRKRLMYKKNSAFL